MNWDQIHPPVTWAIRCEELGSLMLTGLIVFLIALPIRFLIGRGSAKRKRTGNWVMGCMLAGWLVGAIVGVLMVDNRFYYVGEADVGLAWFGLLVGWPIGMILGFYANRRAALGQSPGIEPKSI